MADQTKGSGKPKADAKKKDSTTVLLTPEELRAVAGGASVGGTKIISTPDTKPKIKH